MSDILAVVVNEESQIEYHRDKPLPELQQQFLDKMDREMDGGIVLSGLKHDAPGKVQRAQFVAINLINAIHSEDGELAAAMCAYLANRLPDLKQVRAVEKDDGTLIDLVFDEPYVHQVKVNIIPPGTSGSQLH